jgi:hypothetical protein
MMKTRYCEMCLENASGLQPVRYDEDGPTCPFHGALYQIQTVTLQDAKNEVYNLKDRVFRLQNRIVEAERNE